MLVNEAAKDLSIKIGAKKFRVHKAVLRSQSNVLAQLMDSNPEVDSLELTEISEGTFREILNFMYNSTAPSESANLIELFSASGRLNILPLMSNVAQLLLNRLDSKNALDIIVVGNKDCNFEELKMKAEQFPQQMLLPELASQSEKLKKLLKAKLEMDQVVAEMHR
jgi:BTB/POZ domain